MLFYCLKCRKNTESKNPKVIKIKIERIRLLSKCAACESQRLKIIKKKSCNHVHNNFRLFDGKDYL